MLFLFLLLGNIQICIQNIILDLLDCKLNVFKIRIKVLSPVFLKANSDQEINITVSAILDIILATRWRLL